MLSLMREGDNGITPLPGGLTPPLLNDDATKTLLDEQLGDGTTVAAVEQCRKALNQKPIDRSSACESCGPASIIIWPRIGSLPPAGSPPRTRIEQRWTTGDRLLIYAHGQAGLSSRWRRISFVLHRSPDASDCSTC
ncbi:MAG: hypothetical protein U0361_15450 [Nitrospiraceae bacterium]